jgi:hypothetical protein
MHLRLSSPFKWRICHWGIERKFLLLLADTVNQRKVNWAGNSIKSGNAEWGKDAPERMLRAGNGRGYFPGFEAVF